MAGDPRDRPEGEAMSDQPRRSLMPPGQQRHVLVMAVSGLSFIIVLALIGLLLRLVG